MINYIHSFYDTILSIGYYLGMGSISDKGKFSHSFENSFSKSAAFYQSFLMNINKYKYSQLTLMQWLQGREICYSHVSYVLP